MDSKWLNAQFRNNPQKSKAGLAEAIGLGAPAISKMLAGKRQIKAQEYLAMRRYFGLPADGQGAIRDPASCYVLDPLDKGLGEPDNNQEAASESWIMPASLLRSRTKAPPEKIRIFSVQEKTMAPDFMPGEQVLVDLSDQQPSPPGVFVISDGLGYIVRQCAYVPHSDPPAVQMSVASGKYESYRVPLQKAGIIGRVIAKLEWL